MKVQKVVLYSFVVREITTVLLRCLEIDSFGFTRKKLGNYLEAKNKIAKFQGFDTVGNFDLTRKSGQSGLPTIN